MRLSHSVVDLWTLRVTAFTDRNPCIRNCQLYAATDDLSLPTLVTTAAIEPLRILIVEDEPLIRMALEEFLEGRGHVCSHATTVADALTLMGTQTFDAALLDISLKNENVYPVVRTLQDRGVRCVFVTGHLREHLPAEFAHIRHIEKPFEEDAVIAALEGCRG